MARHKDCEWNLPDGTPNGFGGNTHTYASIQCALLMDIRDRLDRELRVLECNNTYRIPLLLQKIASNTSRRRQRVDAMVCRKAATRKARALRRRSLC